MFGVWGLFGVAWFIWLIVSSLGRNEKAKREGFGNLQDYYNARMRPEHPLHPKARGMRI